MHSIGCWNLQMLFYFNKLAQVFNIEFRMSIFILWYTHICFRSSSIFSSFVQIKFATNLCQRENEYNTRVKLFNNNNSNYSRKASCFIARLNWYLSITVHDTIKLTLFIHIIACTRHFYCILFYYCIVYQVEYGWNWFQSHQVFNYVYNLLCTFVFGMYCKLVFISSTTDADRFSVELCFPVVVGLILFLRIPFLFIQLLFS